MTANVVVIVFPSQSILLRALEHLRALKTLQFKRAAVVTRGHDGELVILDDRIGTTEAAIAGTVIGAALALFSIIVLGALSLPLLPMLFTLILTALIGGLLGNLTGMFASKLFRSKFDHEQIRQLAAHLKDGQLALVMETVNAEAALETLRVELKDYLAELIAPLNQAIRGRSQTDID